MVLLMPVTSNGMGFFWCLSFLTVRNRGFYQMTYPKGDSIWDKALIVTVSEKNIFCFDSIMLLLHMVL